MKDYKSNLPQGTKLQYVMQIAKWEAATHDSLINDHIKPHYTQKSAPDSTSYFECKVIGHFLPKRSSLLSTATFLSSKRHIWSENLKRWQQVTLQITTTIYSEILRWVYIKIHIFWLAVYRDTFRYNYIFIDHIWSWKIDIWHSARVAKILHIFEDLLEKNYIFIRARRRHNYI